MKPTPFRVSLRKIGEQEGHGRCRHHSIMWCGDKTNKQSSQKNNPDKFLEDGVFKLTDEEVIYLRPKFRLQILLLNPASIQKHSQKYKNNIEQQSKIQRFGEMLSNIVMPDLEASETESSLEINFLIGKTYYKANKKQNDSDQTEIK